MNKRVITTIVAMMALVVLFSPVVFDDSDAFVVEQNGIVISTVDEGDISLTISGGKSDTVKLYITNTTTSPIALGVKTTGFNDDVSTDVVAPSLLTAKDGDNYVSTIEVTISIDSYAGNGSTEGDIVITTRDTTGSGPNVFTIPVYLTLESAYTEGDAYNKFFGIFPNTLGAPLDTPWATAAITFTIWIILTIIVSEIVIPMFTKLVGNRKTKEEKKSLRNHLTETITALMIVIALNECAQIVGADPEILYVIQGISTVLYIILGAIIIWQVYMFVVTAFLSGLDERAGIDGMDMSLLPLFKMVGKLVLCVVGVCAALSAFGVDLAGIMVSAGVITLGITLGAQNTLNQFFSGIVLLATRPFKKDDFVSITGNVYIVRKVRLMYTEFYNWDIDQTVTIPNNIVSSSTIVNLTTHPQRTRVFAYVDVAYGSDIDQTKACLETAGMKHPNVIKDGSCTMPSARLIDFGASGIRFRLACYVDSFDNSSHYTGQLRELIYKEFNDNGIEIPYSRIQVDILSDPVDYRSE